MNVVSAIISLALATASLTPSWVYQDSPVNSWTNNSWATVNLNNKTIVQKGTSSIVVVMTPWSALYFTNPSFSIAGKINLSMQVNPGSNVNPTLMVRFMSNGVLGSGILLAPVCTNGELKINTWTLCTIPISAVAPTGTTITGFAIQEFLGMNLQPMYFDEIGFDVVSTKPSVAVVINPQVITFQSQQNTFSSNIPVTWSIEEGNGGIISSTGKYYPNNVVGTYHVVATSIADRTQLSKAIINVVQANSSSSSSSSGGSSSGPPTMPPANGKWVSGYYVGYQKNMYPPASVDFTAITHLVFGAALPRSDGTLDTQFYIDPVNGPLLAKDLSSRAHQAGRKAILMIGGSGSVEQWVDPASVSKRSIFVNNILNTMNSLGYDGVDLDWEPIAVSDAPVLLALTQALRAASPNMIITIPVTWLGAYSQADSWFAQLAPYVDQINIMSYQMAGAWPGWKSWHSGALAGETQTTPSSVSSSAKAYAALGIPKSKIGIGIGFYGSCWKGVTDSNQSVAGANILQNDNVMTYDNIMSNYYSINAYKWDQVASVPSLHFSPPHGAEGCTWISYEDDSSIKAKGKWVNDNGYGGTIIWTINQGYIKQFNINPLLDSVKQSFLQ